MRKWLFAALSVSLCVAEMSALAAVSPRTRTESAKGAAPVETTRSATRQQTTRSATVGRSAIKPTTATTPQKTVSARAATTQKVINTGTKVATATENTLISKECQDAFYGCMDSFCMLDNASGGRCRCSDKINELDKVQEDILKLDEQSYAMATEGVERINMGDTADEIIANAKAAADKVTNKEEESKKKVRTLDLSAWNNNIFGEDSEDLFDALDMTSSSTELDKTGKALYTSSAKMCLGQMPTECRSSLQMLQNVYAQKIKSDCMAYENSLKQQKNASAQKLQAAEKALRDAALDKYQEQNKYGLGQCQLRYAQCMQTTAGCGDDYSGCVTLAAAENVKSSGQSTKKAKQTTIKGTLSSIKLAASTIDQLNSKKPICDDEVLKYCVNVKDKVWDAFLVEAAPALKSAELVAEDKLRQNCITDVAQCFQSGCKAQFDPSREMGQYDMCLSEPELLVDLCKVKLDPCLAATGGSLTDLDGSRLWLGVKAMLNAMRVDTCTLEVKDCIEGICGSDFATCVGMTPDSIADLCPVDKLTACMEKNDAGTVRGYIAEIAQGYALQINDALATQCENAARAAMVKVCGDADTCDGLELGSISFDGLLKPMLCPDGYSDVSECSNNANGFEQSEILKGEVTAQITNRVNINAVVFSGNKFQYMASDTNRAGYIENDSSVITDLLTGLDNVVKNKIKVMEQDKVVDQCMHGRNERGFNGKSIVNNTSKQKGYTKLLDSYENIVRDKALQLLKQKYERAESDLRPELDALTDMVSARLTNITAAQAEELHATNRCRCAELAFEKNKNANTYGAEDSIFGLDVQKRNYTFDLIQSEDSSVCKSTVEVGICDDYMYGSFCGYGESKFFSTGDGRNKKRSKLVWYQASYDSVNSVCAITPMNFNCEKYNTNRCRKWNTTGELGSPEIIQMPRPNLETMITNSK